MIIRTSRRLFLKTTATAASATAAGGNWLPETLSAAATPNGVAIVLNPDDATQKPIQWAAAELRDGLKGKDVASEIFSSLEQAPVSFDCIVAANARSSSATKAVVAAGISLPEAPEAVGLGRGRLGDRSF